MDRDRDNFCEFGICAGGSFRLHVWKSLNREQYRYAVAIEVHGPVNWWRNLEESAPFWTDDQALEEGRKAMSRLMDYYEDAAPWGGKTDGT